MKKPRCSQCGKQYGAKACGPTHALIAETAHPTKIEQAERAVLQLASDWADEFLEEPEADQGWKDADIGLWRAVAALRRERKNAAARALRAGSKKR
jgi:hypothetical protein